MAGAARDACLRTQQGPMIEPADDADAYEHANDDRCLTAAIAYGLLQGIDIEADNCDDGEHGCPLCPWSQTAKQHRYYLANFGMTNT